MPIEDDVITAEEFRSRHQLAAVMVSGDTPCLILDRRFRRVGDQVDGFIVAEIRERSVVFESPHERVVLELPTPASAPEG